MYILLVPLLLLVLTIIGIVLLVIRKYKMSAVMIVTALVVNVYTETFPLHFLQSVSSEQFSSKSESHLCVLTYNLGHLDCNVNNYASLDSFFRMKNADLLILPECRPQIRPEVHSILRHLYPYNITDAFDIDPRYIETFVYSRYPIEKVSHLSDYVYSMNIVLPNQQRLCLVACHLQSNQWHSSLNGGDGLLKNIHNGYQKRLKQTEIIIDSITNIEIPIIVCGDMNDISGSSVLRTLQNGINLNDAWWEGGCGYGPTFTGKHLYLRLDHILYSHHLSLKHVWIPSVNYSDHRPLIAEFRW